jgi:hypothetical protein
MKHFDRVAQVITYNESGVLGIGDALPGFRTFLGANDGVVNLESVYLIIDRNGVDMEIGIGHITAWDEGSPETTSELNRDTVLWSTNGGERIAVYGEGDGQDVVYCVPLAMHAVVATPAWAGSSEFDLHGASSRSGTLGVLASGVGAYAGEDNSTALGALAQALANGSVALGARAIAGVPGAVASGDGNVTPYRGHALTWTGSETSAGTDPVHIACSGLNFTPQADAAYLLDVQVVGRRTAPSLALYCATITAAVLCEFEAPVVIVGTPIKTDIAGVSGVLADCSITVNSDVEIAIVGQGGSSGEAWQWAATIRATEQRGA